MTMKYRTIHPAMTGVLMAIAAFVIPGLAHASGSEAYVPMGAVDKVAVLNLETYRVDGTVDGVINSHGADMTPDGRYVVAGSLTPRPAEQTPGQPEGVSDSDHAAHHGDGADSAEAGGPGGTLYVIDTNKRTVVRRYEVPGPVHHVEITDDGRYAVSTHPAGGGISVVSLETGKVEAHIATGPTPNYIVESPDGSLLYVSNSGNGTISEVDTKEWFVRRNLRVGGSPEHMALDAQRNRLYANDVSAGRAVAVDLASGDTVDEYLVGPTPHGLALSGDDSAVYATSKGGNRLVSIDPEDGTVREREFAPAPYHVAVNPVDSRLLVSSRENPVLWVIDPVTLERERNIELGGIGHQAAFTLP
jgi:YVTN family beta-propeller protein